MVTPENHAVFPEGFDPEAQSSAAPQRPQPTMAELMEAIANLAQQIPTPQQVQLAAEQAAQRTTDKAINDQRQQAEREQEQAIAEFQRKAAEIKAQQSNGHGNANGINGNGAQVPVQQQGMALSDAGGTGGKVGDVIKIGSALLKILSDNLTPMTNSLLDFQMKRQQIRLLQTSPIAMAQQMFALNQQEAMFVGMMLAPDTLKQMYPTMVASAVDATTQAMRAGMLRSGWQPPSNSTGQPQGGPGAWVVLPDGRQVWDPRAPTGPAPQPVPSGGAPAPSPLGSPVTLDPAKVPGFGPGAGSPSPVAPVPGQAPSPTSGPSASPAPTPNAGGAAPAPSSGSTSPPNLSPSNSSPNTFSPSPNAVTMGARDSILLRMRR